MALSHHKIRISAYPAGTPIYMYEADQMRLNNIYAVNPNDKRRYLAPDLLYESSDEKIYSSEVRDRFGNRDCFHTFHEIDATINIGSVKGVKTFTPHQPPGWGPLIEYQLYRASLGQQLVVGKGYNPSPGTYILVRESTADRYVECVFKDDRLWSTQTREVTRRWIFTDLTEELGVEVTTTFTFSDYAKNNGASASFEYVRSEYRAVKPYLVGYVDADQINFDAALALIQGVTPLKMRSHYEPDVILDDVYEKLAIPDVNNVENLRDLKHIRKALPPILQLLRKRNIKSLAQFYLWYKYSFSTTCLDLRSYYEFFQKWIQESKSDANSKRISLTYRRDLSGPTISGDEVTRYLIITDTYSIGVLRTLGLDINMSNAWDLLPFSFVVDWFINLGDIFSRLDHSDVLSELKIQTVIKSTKCTYVSQPLLALSCQSSCYSSYYYRDIDNKIPLGNLGVSLKNPISHLLDGGALAISCKR